MKNATILGKFAQLINILEPKALIDVFEETEDGGQRIVYCSKPVYSLYPLLDVSCEDKHGDYKVHTDSEGELICQTTSADTPLRTAR